MCKLESKTYHQLMEPVCEITIVVYEGHCATTVKCGNNRTFDEVLVGMEKAKAAIQTQIENKKQCPFSAMKEDR